MNLSQLEFFISLAEHKSFKKAAEHMNVSVAAVSKQISLLEEEWGFQLFIRHYKTVELTLSGEIMNNMLLHTSQDYTQALIDALQQAKENKPVISIGIIEKLKMKDLYETLQTVQKNHPGIYFYIESLPVQDLILRQAGGKFDIVIIHEQLINSLYPVEKRIIGQLEFALYISKNHPHIDEIMKGKIDSELYFYAPSNLVRSYSSDIDFIQKVYGFLPKRVILMPNLDSILLATSGANGIAFIDTGIFVPDELNLQAIPSGIKFNEALIWSALPNNLLIDTIGQEIYSTMQKRKNE